VPGGRKHKTTNKEKTAEKNFSGPITRRQEKKPERILHKKKPVRGGKAEKKPKGRKAGTVRRRRRRGR